MKDTEVKVVLLTNDAGNQVRLPSHSSFPLTFE